MNFIKPKTLSYISSGGNPKLYLLDSNLPKAIFFTPICKRQGIFSATICLQTAQKLPGKCITHRLNAHSIKP